MEQLRQVFAELHAPTVREVVSLHNPWSAFDADGGAPGLVASEPAAKAMLDRLAWWTDALRTARAATPYAA